MVAWVAEVAVAAWAEVQVAAEGSWEVGRRVGE